MALLDIFDGDAFTVHSLTLAMETLPYEPGRIGRMGLFQQQPITTQVAIIEERQGKLSLLPTLPRGSENQTALPGQRRRIRSVVVPHVPYWSAVLAQDLEGKRAFGSEDQLEVFSAVVNDNLERMKRDHEVTREYHRVGAVQGIVLDADGTTELYNWFTEFGVTENVVAFDFGDAGDYDNAAPVHDIKAKAQEVKRTIQDALGGISFTGIHAFCGDEFFDALIRHATVRRAYERFQENSWARSAAPEEGGFEFAGITWENYRGSVGGVDFFPDDEARFFPTGVRDVFLEIPAPADFIETVNTRGLLEYAKQERMKWDKGIELHTQSNVLYMCTRPGALVKGTAVNLSGAITTTTTTTTTTTV